MFPCPRLAFGEGAERQNRQGTSSSSNLFCLDLGSNGAPECPEARACLVSLLVINRRTVYSTRLSILAWISNALVLWGPSKRCCYQAQVCGCHREQLGPRLSILQRRQPGLSPALLAGVSRVLCRAPRVPGPGGRSETSSLCCCIQRPVGAKG